MITQVALKRCKFALMMLIFAASSYSVQAEVYFEEDFKAKSISQSSSPVWSWNIIDDIQRGMMVGDRDIHQVIEGEIFLSHRNSLRMDFDGRNGFCNTCGGDDVEVVSVSSDTACVNSPNGPYEDIVYSKTNNFSTWKVLSTSDQQVCFDIGSPVSPGMKGISPSVQVGDSVYLPKVCGVNGTVGGGNSPNRRSDCNKAINYLTGVSSEQWNYGDTISRRFYLYIPKETEVPNTTFKVGYAHWKNTRAVLAISTQRNMTLIVDLPDGGSVAYSRDDQDAVRVERDSWFYFEEVFTRETSGQSDDGTYTLYAGNSDDDLETPLVHKNDVTYGDIVDMSIGGNWQHTNDVYGYVYFDNIRISTEKSGPVNRPVINQ